VHKFKQQYFLRQTCQIDHSQVCRGIHRIVFQLLVAIARDRVVHITVLPPHADADVEAQEEQVKEVEPPAGRGVRFLDTRPQDVYAWVPASYTVHTPVHGIEGVRE
jgi:hypothetical protein